MEDKDGHPRVSSQGPDAVAPAGSFCPPPDKPMPSSGHPRPLISTLGWDVNTIVASYPNFCHIKRIHHSSPNAKVDVVVPEVEIDGNPLIITGWNRHFRWPKALFNIDWLRKKGDQNPTVRNIHTWSDFKISMDDLIKKLRETPAYASEDEQERLYGKDGDCPSEWTEWLSSSGAIPNDLLFHGSNDFLKFLPDKAKVQTLMCYMGIGDTFTPFHKDLCASSGQNLMCFSEHGGSAFWFMTQSSAAPQVAAYFHQLGQEVDLETHVVTIEELAKAPFKVYIAEQQLGDLVLVPPRSCHQVVNKGGITIKTSWSRMSLNGLQTALWHELPVYHRVCRQEIYKVKCNIFHALQHFTGLVEDLPEGSKNESCPTSTEHLKQLVYLFDDILASEFSISRDSMPHVSQSGVPHADDLHCDFCGADIFQSFFECDSCLPPSSSGVSAGVLPIGDGLVLCPSCYVEGRTCRCEDMQPVQCRPFKDLLEIRDRAIRAIERIDSDYINAYGYLFEQPLQLLSGKNANIFEAACRLCQKRHTDTNATRSCRVRLPHLVPTPAAVYCKPCHSSKCYNHLLEVDSVHSVDAMMISDLADGDAKLHQHHRDALRQYEEVRRSVIEDEERGSRPNPSHKLTYLAKTFTTCRAIASEVTKHGWYDRLVQTSSIPIANSPAKALARLSDESDGNKPCSSHAADDFSSSNLATPASKYDELNPHLPSIATLVTPSTPPRHVNEVRLPGQSTSSVIPGSHSPIFDPMPLPTASDAFQVFGTPTNTSIAVQRDISSSVPALSSPLSSRRLPAAAPPQSFGTDDPGMLSDLTELPSEVDYSPPRSSIIATVSNHQPPMEFSPPPSSAEVISKTRSEASSTLKPRVFLKCVEIPQSSRQKRRRITGSFLSNVAGPSGSDVLPSTAQEADNGSLSRRKRKMTKGPASRPLSSSQRTYFPFDTRDHLPSDNILANALNQTFQLNSTTAASHVSTTTVFIDATPPVNPTVTPKYRDAGVQKNLNFTRHTATTQPSEDPSSCIMRLEAENRDLRAQTEAQRHDYERYRESFEEIQRRYNLLGHHPAGPANFASPPVDFFAHPRWRMRGESQFQSADLEQSDISMETLPLPTPSSPESASPTQRRRTPTGPRNFGMRGRGDHTPSGQPYMRPQHHRRRRGTSYPVNGKKLKGRLQGPRSFDHSERLTEEPAPTNAAGEAVSPTADANHDKGWYSASDVPLESDIGIAVPPSPISDRVQPPESPNVP